jgi:putative transport protein
MNTFATLLSHPVFVVFFVVALGIGLGRLQVRGVGLGTSGVLFVAIVAGHFGLSPPEGVGTLGLVVFVYCMGVGAGTTFVSVLARDGTKLATLAAVIVTTGAAAAWSTAAFFELPSPLVGGIFAGALTSTPALAAAREASADAAAQVAVGYAIAYPLGVIGVVLFVQLLPRLGPLRSTATMSIEGDPEAPNRVDTVLVEVTNGNLVGKRIAESGIARFNACVVSRVLQGERLQPLRYDDAFELGQHLLLVGRPKEIDIAVDFLGQRSDRPHIKDVENEQRRLVVTARPIIGTTLRELRPLKDHGVVVTRITRHEITFVPNADTRLENHDILLTVGPPALLDAFASHIGHRTRAFDETDLLSLALGIALGIALGMAPFGLPGSEPITLGMAGGPLVVALILGHFGRVGGIVGYIPRPTRLALQELGLVFFLADAGMEGGRHMVSTLSAFGPSVVGVGMATTVVPLGVAWVVARHGYGLDMLQSLGGICGGMTSTPALGVLSSVTDSNVPAVSYAAAYPVALILMTMVARALVGWVA